MGRGELGKIDELINRLLSLPFVSFVSPPHVTVAIVRQHETDAYAILLDKGKKGKRNGRHKNY